MSEANGVSRSLMQYREMTLQAVGFDAKQAEEIAPTMEGKLRTEVAAEAMALARAKGVYTEPGPPADDSPADPAELRKRYGRRRY